MIMYTAQEFFDFKKKGIFVFNTILLKDKIDKIESLLKKSNLKIKYIYSIRNYWN